MARGIMMYEPAMGTIDALAEGRDAFARQAWTQAHTQLSAADRVAALELEDVERLAVSAYLIGLDEASEDLWARAHAECVRRRDIPRATRCSFWLVVDLLTRGQAARANGWLARAQRLLDDEACECAERGLLLAVVARWQIKEGNLTAASEAAREAVELADRFHDPELQVFSRLSLGQVCVRQSDISKAASLFDEIMVAVTVGDVSPLAIGVVYCAVIEGCYSLFDLGRAREWTSALSRWCGAQPDLVPFRGQCLVHRAEVLRLNGAWAEAMEEAAKVPATRHPPGSAFYQVAEIHRLRGDFAKADEAYQQASQHGHAPEPGLALLRLAQGRHRVAEAAIRRGLAETQSRWKRAEMLAACVEIMIAVADLPAARSAEGELRAMAADCNTPFLRTVASHATGSLLLAEGRAGAALPHLREAWSGWQELEAPWEAARVRVLLGIACRELADDDTASLEFDAAQRVFIRLGAAADVARVARLSGNQDKSGVGMLTERERQVIALVATGKTNRAIAEGLAISERTVDRHVSNILSKLDLPSRTAATAYAYEHGLI